MKIVSTSPGLPYTIKFLKLKSYIDPVTDQGSAVLVQCCRANTDDLGHVIKYKIT